MSKEEKVSENKNVELEKGESEDNQKEEIVTGFVEIKEEKFENNVNGKNPNDNEEKVEMDGKEEKGDDADVESGKEDEEKKNDENEDDDDKSGDESKKIPGEVVDPNFNMDEVLQTKVKLSDDTECPIFSRGPRYPDYWPINCHLCGTAHILNATELKKHINEATHKEKLAADTVDTESFRKPLIQPFCKPLTRLNNPIKIYPGEIIEIISPEFYDRLQKIEEFEFRKPSFKALLEILEDEPIHVYNESAPVLGLSYILKFRNPFSVIDYFCLLCKAKCSGEAYQHLVGGVHQMNYIHKHFPNLFKKVKDGLEGLKPESMKERCIRSIFRKIYKKFEELRGHRKIHIILFKDYKMGKKEKFRKFQFRKLVHYDENMLEIPQKDLQEWIEKCKNGEIIIEADPISLTHPKKGYRDVDPHKKKRRLESPKRRVSPPQRKKEKEYLDDTPNNWDRYRRMLGAALDDLDREFEDYEEVPEKHPGYETEWRKYWRRRSKELERDNIDPSYYDFKPEWLDYWADLLKDLHRKEVAKCKFEIKRKLRLPYDKRSPSPIRRRRRSRSTRRPLSRSRSRSHSRLRRRRSPSPGHGYRDRRRHSRSRSPRNYHDRSRSRHERDENTAFVTAAQEPLGVISVLRQLTVLEDQLGSLGPKALEYLSRAVLFEKERDKSADELMREKEFYIFFVTAKEKLKGQLMANIVERSKLKAANNAVNDLETLLNMFEDYVRHSSGRNPFTNIGSHSMPIYMGNQGGDNILLPPTRNVFDAAPNTNSMNPNMRRMPRHMNEVVPPSRSQYNQQQPPSSIPPSTKSEDDDMIEAPPPPRNLFNVQSDNENNDQIENTTLHYNPSSDYRNKFAQSSHQSYGVMDEAVSDNPSRPYSRGDNRNQQQQQKQQQQQQQSIQYPGAKGGVWHSGNQNVRNEGYNIPSYFGNIAGGGSNYQNSQSYQQGTSSGMAMMNTSSMGSGRGYAGFRTGNNRPQHNMSMGNNSFRGVMSRGYNS